MCWKGRVAYDCGREAIVIARDRLFYFEVRRLKLTELFSSSFAVCIYALMEGER
jgi:hypothetical protein